jgi:hypothetical protein
MVSGTELASSGVPSGSTACLPTISGYPILWNIKLPFRFVPGQQPVRIGVSESKSPGFIVWSLCFL